MRLQEQQIDTIVCDSRQAGPHSAFVCIEGARSDGHAYASQAYRQGCRLFVCQHALDLPDDAAQMLVPDTRIALAELSAAFYGYPAERLRVIGVTGTKGKSTVASLLCDTFNAAGHACALIGTTGITIGGEHMETANSTPESLILHRTFARALAAGCEYVVMEVSSQGEKQHRVHGIPFAAAVFTNLSPDHISPTEHADYAEYRACKAKLFAQTSYAFLNMDDPAFEEMRAAAHCPVETYGVEKAADWRAESILTKARNGVPGMTYRLNGEEYHIAMPGMFSVSNALAVTAVCRHFGIDGKVISSVLASASVPGRFERVGALPDRMFVIDYAHNGVSLRAILEVLRSYQPHRLICLFGSVGGRTQGRRRELAVSARALCDFCILTSDNPDFEEPMQIINEIASYLDGCPYVAIPDRAEAVAWAVRHAEPGDIVLFAGKGHERYQLIDGIKQPFCERALIEREIAAVAAQS